MSVETVVARAQRVVADLGLSDSPDTDVRLHLRGRHDTTIVSDADEHAWFVKTVGAPLLAGDLNLSREALFHRLLASDDALKPLRSMVPTLVGVADDDEALVFEMLRDATPLYQLANRGVVSDAARLVGRALACLHGAPTSTAEEIPVIENPVQTFRSWTPEMLANSPPSVIEFLALVQGKPRLDELLEELGEQWRAESIIHGDATVSNVLIVAGRDGPSARLVDWELLGIGDPAWDCGSFIGSLCHLWVDRFALGMDPQAARDDGALLREAFAAFLGAYADHRVATDLAADDWEARVFRWAGYWLLQRVLTLAPAQRQLSAVGISALHLAGQLLSEATDE